MPKDKKKQKQLEMLELEKMNQQMNKTGPTNFFSRKSTYFFNLENENANLQTKIIQDKKKADWLKTEIKKIHTKMENSMNAASIQYEKMKEKIV